MPQTVVDVWAACRAMLRRFKAPAALGSQAQRPQHGPRARPALSPTSRSATTFGCSARRITATSRRRSARGSLEARCRRPLVGLGPAGPGEAPGASLRGEAARAAAAVAMRWLLLWGSFLTICRSWGGQRARRSDRLRGRGSRGGGDTQRRSSDTVVSASAMRGAPLSM